MLIILQDDTDAGTILTYTIDTKLVVFCSTFECATPMCRFHYPATHFSHPIPNILVIGELNYEVHPLLRFSYTDLREASISEEKVGTV